MKEEIWVFLDFLFFFKDMKNYKESRQNERKR